jgi:predicted TIM-barrel fold metal-dependent hydrolase
VKRNPGLPDFAPLHPGYGLQSWYDQIAPFTDYIGADHILWSANLPLANSTWPRTRETIDHCFKGVSAEGRERVLWKNAAELYRLWDVR